MLRESNAANDKDFDLHQVTEGGGSATDIPNAALLMRFAEAIVVKDTPAIAAARTEIRDRMGEAALVDAAGIASAFHGFVRVADAIGIPYDGAAGGQGSTSAAIRSEIGIDAFYRATAE